MKTWLKVLLGIAVGLAALLALGIASAVRSGRWTQAKQFAGGMTQLVSQAKALERFEKEHPFRPPEDGNLPEERLLAYLEVCALLKPYEKPFEAWMAEHAGKKGDFAEAAQAVSFMGQVVREVQGTLRARSMGTRELAWIHRGVKASMRELQDLEGAPKTRELLGILERTAKDPALPEGTRRTLQDELLRFRREAGEGQALSANARLVQSHRARIAETDPGELMDLILGGVPSQDGRRGRIVVAR